MIQRLVAPSHVHHSDSSSAVPGAPDIRGVFFGININSRGLFACRMTIRLHIVARLENQVAFPRDDCPKQTAGKRSLERAVAVGTAGVRVCLVDVLEIVIRIGCGYVVSANVLGSFDSGQHYSFIFNRVVAK